MGHEFSELTNARGHLGVLVEESLAECRRRFGRATKVKNGDDNYTIKIGDQHSVSDWATHCIIKY